MKISIWLPSLLKRVLIGVALGLNAQAANPILPASAYIPDGEPRVFGDRVYLYGSHDNANATTYCDYKLRVWSAPLNDLNNWYDHGISFSTITVDGHADDVPYSNNRLYAPDVVRGVDGKYYLYAYIVGSPCAVAVSSSPAGPFTFVSRINVAGGGALDGGQYIDPGVLVDDDGKTYVYWGYNQSGLVQVNSATMTDAYPETYQPDIIPTTAPFNFFEGCSPRKINGTYYLVYADGGKLVYATSAAPTGPFTYGGVIVQQSNGAPGGNIHGGLAQINGQWYIFYHRMTNNTLFSRRACVEKVTIQPDGSIREVEQTSLGFEDSLNPYQQCRADTACVLGNGNYVTEEDPATQPVIKNKANSVIGYKYFDFGSSTLAEDTVFSAVIREGLTSGTMEIWLDSTTVGVGMKIGQVTITPTVPANTAWRTVSTSVPSISGRRALYFKFLAADTVSMIGDVKSFSFAKSPAATRGSVSLTASDALDATSFTTATRWSNTQLPSDANHYSTAGFLLRTPANATGNTVFAGRSLTIATNGQLLFKGATGSSITIPSLNLTGGSIKNGNGSNTTTLLGDINVSAPSTLDADTSGRVVNIAAPLRGSGNLSVVAAAGAGGSITLTGANDAFTGNWSIASSTATLQVGTGGAGGNLGTGNISNSGKLVFNRTGNLVVTNPISGTGGVDSLAATYLVFTGNNTYTGPTTISAGVLLVNGSLGNTPVSIGAAATLGGTGSIAGPVTVNGAFSPGVAGIGTQSFGAALTLSGTSLFEINTLATPRNDSATVAAAITAGGTLTLKNTGPALAAGDTFALFNKAVTGAFASLILPPLGYGLTWQNNLATIGTLTVIGIPVGLATAPSIADGATSVTQLPRLTWTAGSYALTHRVYLGTSAAAVTNATPASPEYKGEQPGTTFTPAALATGTTYYWRIDEVGVATVTPGTVWSFTTTAIPVTANTAPSPANAVTEVALNASLGWTAGTNATSHRVYFGTSASAVLDATPASPEYKGEQTGRTFAPGLLVNGTTYYWRVDAVVGSTVTQGPVWSFTALTIKVTLTASDGFGTTSFNVAGNWSNALAPAPTSAYFTSNKELRTPSSSTGTLTFAGSSLSIDAGGRLRLKGSSGSAISVAALKLNGGTIDNSNGSNTQTIFGNLTVTADSTLDTGEPTRSIDYACAISGSRNLNVICSGGTGAVARLTGTNDAYTGNWTIASTAVLQVGGSGGAGTTGGLGTGNITNNGVLTFNRTGALTVPGAISGPGTLNSNVALALTLTGNNTYTGNTTISAGSLLLAGSLGNTAVTIAPSATLEGTGSIAGPVALNGALRPGTAAPGALSFGGALTLNGSAVFELNTATAPRNDSILVTGAFTAGGTLTVVNSGPALVAGNTFALFSKAPTGSFTSVSLPSLATGLVWQNKLATNGTITVQTLYDQWAANAGLTSGGNDAPSSDPDADGIPNLMEFVLAGNPLQRDAAILPTMSVTGGNLVFTFLRADASESGTTVTAQYGTDLATWTDVPVGAGNSVAGAVNVTVSENSTAPDAVTVTIPLDPSGRIFCRLKATKP